MLRSHPIGPVPADTARIAHAAFPKGHPYLRLADELGPLFTDETCATLFSIHGQPALSPWLAAGSFYHRFLLPPSAATRGPSVHGPPDLL